MLLLQLTMVYMHSSISRLRTKKVSLWLFLEIFLSFFYLPHNEYKGQQGFVAAIAKFLHTQDSELMTFAFDGDSGASARPVARLA